MLCTAPAPAQDDATARARAQLDAARAMIDPDAGYTAARQYAELVPLEVRAGRPDQARQHTFMIRGIMAEDTTTNPDRYLHLIAGAHLDQGETNTAVNILGQVERPDITTEQFYLRAVHQLTADFGLQHSVTLAREAFPEVMDRRAVYSKLCYTLAEHGHGDQALEFISVVMDLSEVYQKLDAFRYTAVGMHEQGDHDGAVRVLEQAQAQAEAYSVATTRVVMLIDLATTFHEIGETQRGRAAMLPAEAAFGEIEEDNYQRDTMMKKIARGWAVVGEYDRALAWLDRAGGTLDRDAVLSELIRHDLAAGRIDRATALNDERNVLSDTDFAVASAFAALERGDTASATAGLRALAGDRFSSKDWLREAGTVLARHGEFDTIRNISTTLEDPDDRFNLALGVVEGFLPAE